MGFRVLHVLKRPDRPRDRGTKGQRKYDGKQSLQDEWDARDAMRRPIFVWLVLTLTLSAQ